jgi:hypothetical protein
MSQRPLFHACCFGRIHDLENLLIGIVIGIAIGIETLSRPEVFSFRMLERVRPIFMGRIF